MQNMYAITIIFFASVISSAICCFSKDPDACLSTSELIESRGFLSEDHEIITQDGYILTCFRIVHPDIVPNKRPVILQHGLFSSSRDFLVASPDGYANDKSNKTGNNIGFELARAGHDVWLSNSRGNTYSLKHVSRSRWSAKFWQFSFADMAKYDVPAVIDYVINITGHESVAYVGHSQGTVMMWGTLATYEKYNKIVKPIIQMAPSFGFKHMPAPLSAVMKSPLVPLLLGPFDGPFSESSPLTTFMESIMCKEVRPACLLYLALVAGSDIGQINTTRLDVYFYGIPAGSSIKNIRHFHQVFTRDTFGEYDYGRRKNMQIYGQEDPPAFDVGKITNPNIALFCGKNDLLASPPDVDILRSRLGVKPIMDYTIPYEKWNHFDFLIAKDTNKYVIKPMLDLLTKYEP